MHAIANVRSYVGMTCFIINCIESQYVDNLYSHILLDRVVYINIKLMYV